MKDTIVADPGTSSDTSGPVKPRKKAFVTSPVPPKPALALNDRPLRHAQYWRVLALLGDQMEESAAKWPTSMTARRHRDEFYKALDGVLSLHQSTWTNESARVAAELRDEDELAERRWFQRNKAIQPTSNPQAS